jgi:hypothetical protein
MLPWIHGLNLPWGRKSAADTSAPALSIPLSDEGMANTCREFLTGLRFLSRYSAHASVNAADIAKDNLRLLHSNLKSFAHYRQLLSIAQLPTDRQSPFQWLPVVDTDELLAGVLTVHRGHRIRLITREKSQNDSEGDAYCMLLDLSGKATVTHYLTGADGRETPGMQLALRAGHVSLIAPQDTGEAHLRATSQQCTLLYVRVPLRQFTAEVPTAKAEQHRTARVFELDHRHTAA